MATIERGVFTSHQTAVWGSDAERALLCGATNEELLARAKEIYITKWLGRVLDAVQLGALLFERLQALGGLRGVDPLVTSGLRAGITAAIARPEVPVSAVRGSIEQLRTWLVAANQPAAICDHLTLDLDATLQPEADLSARARALESHVRGGEFPLHCAPCALQRLAWRCRSTLAPWQLGPFVHGSRCTKDRKALTCNPERFDHLVAQSFLDRGLLEPAEEAYGRAVAAWEAPVLPVPLLATGVELAVRRHHRADLSERLAAFDRAVVDFEYPYVELSRRRRLRDVVPKTRRRFHAVNGPRLATLQRFVAQRVVDVTLEPGRPHVVLPVW